jgi:RNA polymerase primary sigma factor
MSDKYLNFDTEDSVTKYFKEVRKSVLITQEEEIELAKRIKKGDQTAVDTLVKANLKFAISIAKEYVNQGLPLSDLINEANYGLVKAATKFDYSRGWRFISYAVWWIRQSIIQSLNDNARLVRLPANVIYKLSSLKKEIDKFEFENERQPIYGEITDAPKDMLNLYYTPKAMSLNDQVSEDGDELIDLLCAPEEEDSIDVDDRLRAEIQNTLSVLDEREKDIIECYFGINRETEPMTLEAIGDKYSLTKERVRQIKEKSLRKIRHNAQNLYTLLNE